MLINIYAAGYGAVLWLLIAVISGRVEAWDSQLYWLVGLPASLVGAGVLGWIAPAGSWRWGAWIGTGQAVAMMISGMIDGNGFGLLPLGLVAFIILSLPLTMVSSAGGLLALRFKKHD